MQELKLMLKQALSDYRAIIFFLRKLLLRLTAFALTLQGAAAAAAAATLPAKPIRKRALHLNTENVRVSLTQTTFVQSWHL